HRHGWNKVEQHFDLPDDEDAATAAARLRRIPAQGGMLPAVVLRSGGGSIDVVLADGTPLTLDASTSRWTGRAPSALAKRGDVVRVRRIETPVKTAAKDKVKDGDTAGEAVAEAEKPEVKITWQLDQLPRAQAALVSLNPENGALLALTGGFSFAGSKFNRATQARRQPGSSFKPFLYAAAFERGYNPASIVLDAPVVFRMRQGKVWRPQNDDGRFMGPMRLRQALVLS